MKRVMKRLIRDERGAALLLALILLLVGGLIVTPLLAHMGSGILAGEVYEKRTAELYAADAGVEDAIWSIQNGEIPVCSASPGPWCYELSDINGKSLQVCVEYLEGGIHRITSVAVGDSGGVADISSSTAVESYLSVTYVDFFSFLDNAIVSDDTVTVQPGSTVDGDVWLPDEEDLDNKGTIDGEVKDEDDMSLTWPTADYLSSYYWEDVKDLDPYPYDSIDINYHTSIGPLFREGSLTIKNTGSPATLMLNGTIYVTGNLDFAQPSAARNYTIDLNEQTIFVEGDIYFPPKYVRLTGSGCIIAVGEVWFQPIMNSNPDDFILVMSTDDHVWFNPSGDFTGCVAGNVHVQLQPGGTITNNGLDEGQNLNFPIGEGDDPNKLPPVTAVHIDSWEVIQQ